MSRSVCMPALVLVVLLASCTSDAGLPQPTVPPTDPASRRSPPPDCPVTPSVEVRPDIAPGLGNGPVWMIMAAVGEWEGPDFLAKTIWVVDEQVQGPVRIGGRRLDGDGVASFLGYHEYAGDTVSPDSSEIIRGATHGRSTDRRGYVIYLAPGCWRFTAEAGGQVIAEITQYLYDVVR